MTAAPLKAGGGRAAVVANQTCLRHQPSSLSSRRLRRTSRANAFLRVSRGVGLGFGRPLIRLAIRQREAHTAIDRAAITRRPGSISASYKSNGRPSPSPPEPGRKEIICGSKTSSLKHATSAASRPLLLRSNLIQLIPKWSCTHFVVRTAGRSEPFPISQARIAASGIVTFPCYRDHGRPRKVGRWTIEAIGILGRRALSPR